MTFTESFLEAVVGDDSQLDAEFHFIVRSPSLLLFFFSSPHLPLAPPPTLPLCTFLQGYLLFHLSALIVFYAQAQYVLNL